MELRNLDRLAPLSGNVLNSEELAGLEMAMLTTKLNQKLNNELTFWGKIFGTTQDYLITQYIDNFADFPKKIYFYCTTSNYVLASLPPSTLEYDKKSQEILSQFEGDPSFYKYGGVEDEEDPAADEEESEIPKQDNKFREMHRLSYVVKVRFIMFQLILDI
jgi:radial spoke head protein 9